VQGNKKRVSVYLLIEIDTEGLTTPIYLMPIVDVGMFLFIQ